MTTAAIITIVVCIAVSMVVILKLAIDYITNLFTNSKDDFDDYNY